MVPLLAMKLAVNAIDVLVAVVVTTMVVVPAQRAGCSLWPAVVGWAWWWVGVVARAVAGVAVGRSHTESSITTTRRRHHQRQVLCTQLRAAWAELQCLARRDI